MSKTLESLNYTFEHSILEHQLGSLSEFAQCYGYFRISREDAPDSRFWKDFERAQLYLGILHWCSLFGSNSSETHWKKLVPGNAKYQKEIRSIILSAASFDKDSWSIYREKLLTVRNLYIAHNVPESSHKLPHLEPAFQIASAYFDWLVTEFPSSVGRNPKSLRERYLTSQIEACKVIKNGS